MKFPFGQNPTSPFDSGGGFTTRTLLSSATTLAVIKCISHVVVQAHGLESTRELERRTVLAQLISDLALHEGGIRVELCFATSKTSQGQIAFIGVVPGVFHDRNQASLERQERSLETLKWKLIESTNNVDNQDWMTAKIQGPRCLYRASSEAVQREVPTNVRVRRKGRSETSIVPGPGHFSTIA
ncbi:hypothetical protein As57867_004859, partial [Aphanomyces stellatus]